MVLVDPDYIKDRKVFGHVLAAFRYGREDLDVLGLTFRKDLYLASSQIYPQESSCKRAPTRLQVNVLDFFSSCFYFILDGFQEINVIYCAALIILSVIENRKD